VGLVDETMSAFNVLWFTERHPNFKLISQTFNQVTGGVIFHQQ
jgi:hypothetical protein